MAGPYPFDQLFAVDPAGTGRVAANAQVTIFQPGDPSKTPVQITTLSGNPMPNPVQVNEIGFGTAFMHASLDELAWEGGGYSGLLHSYQGMKEVALAAQVAAEAALRQINNGGGGGGGGGTMIPTYEVGGTYTRPTTDPKICVIFTGSADPGAIAFENDRWERI